MAFFYQPMPNSVYCEEIVKIGRCIAPLCAIAALILEIHGCSSWPGSSQLMSRWVEAEQLDTSTRSTIIGSPIVVTGQIYASINQVASVSAYIASESNTIGLLAEVAYNPDTVSGGPVKEATVSAPLTFTKPGTYYLRDGNGSITVGP